MPLDWIVLYVLPDLDICHLMENLCSGSFTYATSGPPWRCVLSAGVLSDLGWIIYPGCHFQQK